MNLPATRRRAPPAATGLPCGGRSTTLARVARAMVLCAGYGTRLRPLTDELPKPLLPFGDRSLLDHALGAFESSGLGGPVIANVHHLTREFERRLPAYGGRLTLVHEPEIRGTAGGIAGARHLLGPAPIVVMIGDVVLPRVPPELCRAAAAGGLALAVAPRARGEGTVGLGANGRLVRLRGERFGEELAGGEYVGLAALGADALAALPEHGCLFGDYALPALRRGAAIATVPYLEKVVLPGDDLASYLRSNLEWLDARAALHYVAPDAQLAPKITLERAIVGRGAQVQGRGALVDCVVLPGAVCSAPLERCVVLPSSRVVKFNKIE